MSKFTRVMSKARKHYPAAPTQYQIETANDGSITIYEDLRKGFTGPAKGSTFAVGDQAEYDAFNLKYIGIITKITDKAVSIMAYPGTQSATLHRLSLYEFCWRNARFNASEAAAYNAVESMYI